VSSRREHYSYAAYADPSMAQSFDDRRFGGPIGALVAETQAQVLASMTGRIHDRTVLDVGTGTGRAARLLARGGARVTAVDASEQMLATARLRAAEEHLSIAFQPGDVHALDFHNRSFDVVVCFRVLMHVPDWRRSLGELCRVADRLIVFDYPSATSAAAAQSLVRGAAQRCGGRSEAYRVFTRRTIARELDRHGFRVRSVHRQFVLPIALHKAIGSRRFTRSSERVLERIGLLPLFGSPVTVCAERCASS
jgi:SAM-dependent methyltransferase